MNKPDQLPPRFADRLLKWYCKEEIYEDLQGDLYEYFDRNVKSKGVFKARMIYWIDVLKFMRLYTIKKPQFINELINWIMLASYIKTSGRNIVRNKLFSAINIFGLALSMSVALIMIAMLRDAHSYDRFHKKYDRIYRLVSQYEYKKNRDEGFHATSSIKAGKALQDNFPGVEDVTILYGGFGGDLDNGKHRVPVRGFWADEAFTKVFSFEMIEGNSATALKEPFSIVLTASAVKKVFGETNVVGRTVSIEEKDYTITGVLQDPPAFSHLQFEALTSLSTRQVTQANNPRELSWDNIWRAYVYMTIKDESSIPVIKQNLELLSEREDKTVTNTHIGLSLQPLGDIVTGEDMSNQAGPTLGKVMLWILGILTIIVVLCACFNYTNLSIARASRRSREVGIRKTIGALQRHVVFQFVVESVLISLIALVLAIGLFIVIRPHFMSLEPTLQQLLKLNLDLPLLLLFVSFAVGVGVFAGFFPALFFSKVNAIQILKSVSTIPMLKGMTARRVLIVVQYSISIIAITATLIMSRQYKHFVNYDLGFETENVLNIRLQGNKARVVMKELAELPEVSALSSSVMITSVGNYYGILAKNPNDHLDSAHVQYNGVDENYLPLHGHEFVAGRNFIFQPDSAANQVIVNEQFVRRFRLAEKSSEEAVGQIVKIDGKDMQIVGVLKDFEYGRVNNSGGKEVAITYAPGDAEYINLKVASSDMLATRAKIESLWKKIDPIHPLEATFYDEEIEKAFEGLKASVKLGGFLAILVIVIASVGLLGMVVFTTETRLKEISIRKVHGASTGRLMFLLSKGFLWLLGIAIAVALPLTYVLFDQVLLAEMANHAPIGSEIFVGVAFILLLALAMIGSQTVKAAQTNPATILKTE